MKNCKIQKKIGIYNGPGVSQECFKQTGSAIKELLPQYYIESMSPSQLIHDSWECNTALFILPGGADMPYLHHLNGRGNQKIRNYVEEGGAFLGICAGSYYAGSFVDFAKNTTQSIQGNRELAFFPGIVKGPLVPYDYFSQTGARAAKLFWNTQQGFTNGKEFTLFYNGGGYFVDASHYKNVNILAFYEKKLPAIIQCKVGKGLAILSGVHFEYNPFLLKFQDSYLEKIHTILYKENAQRMLLMTHLFDRLLQKKVHGLNI